MKIPKNALGKIFVISTTKIYYDFNSQAPARKSNPQAPVLR